MTVNKVANCDEYPKPKTENLSETLNLGGKLIKLGLTQDYQQVLLDEKLSEYLTVNMDKGLFQRIRLKFGVHSALGVFKGK